MGLFIDGAPLAMLFREHPAPVFQFFAVRIGFGCDILAQSNRCSFLIVT